MVTFCEMHIVRKYVCTPSGLVINVFCLELMLFEMCLLKKIAIDQNGLIHPEFFLFCKDDHNVLIHPEYGNLKMHICKYFFSRTASDASTACLNLGPYTLGKKGKKTKLLEIA